MATVEQLHLWAISLAADFQQGEGGSHIDEAIALDREALGCCQPGHPMRPISMILLSVHLSDRYDRFGEMMDLEEAIDLTRDALVLCPPDHPDNSVTLNNLLSYLSSRHDQLGRVEDIDEAIALGRQALALRPQGDPDRSISLDNLAVCLCARYRCVGEVKNLHEAISLSRETLGLCPPGDLHRCKSLDNLAVHLSIRFSQLGAIDDINEAIVLCRDALTLHPPAHPDRARTLDNLATYLSTRYQQVKDQEDINEAIILGRQVLVLFPPGHPKRSLSLESLSRHLTLRHNQVGGIDDLQEAIVHCRAALALLHPGHPDRSTSLYTLGIRLFLRYQRLGEVEDLDEAIAISRDALALLPSGHPDRSETLESLAYYLFTRTTQFTQLKDKEELFSLYAQIAHIPKAVSSADLSAARAWTRDAEYFKHSTILLAYETSLRLLVQHLAALPPLPQHLNVFKNITSSLAVDAFSACLRDHSPIKAIELLEQGRGVFWSQLTHLRSSLDAVISSGPEGEILADKFKQLTSLIRTALNSPGADQHDRICCLNAKLQGVVMDIRDIPGLSYFLLPSLFSDLQKAASGGPVIIVNASKFSCDALIVLLEQDPVHIPLQITRDELRNMSSDLYAFVVRTKLEDMGKYIAVILRKLWQMVVSPIVDILQTIHPRRTRIWWCPTAEFCLLPLHAAGLYRTGQPKFPDLYISSYTPTLAALIRARKHDSEPSDHVGQQKHIIAIGQANATGQSELYSVEAELANVGQRVKSLSAFRSIEGADSCIARVADELNRNEWVHFACHGLANRKRPFASAFALHDGHFTVERIIQCELERAQFAYLSACHTTVGDEECPDEMIHLASAMLFSGFRSVIGTMWAVDDSEAKKITEMFYDNMADESGQLDHTRAAFALHKTTQTLKGLSLDQRILYIHIGV